MTGTLVAGVILGVAESIVLTLFGASWAPAVSFAHAARRAGRAPAGPVREIDACRRSARIDILDRRGASSSPLACATTFLISNEYSFFAGYVVLQFVVLATAWNILGGYAGYVNFGTSAFFGVGVYTAVFLFKATRRAAAGADPGGRGGRRGCSACGVGLLTLRLRGIFFSIATIAVTIILETLHHQLEVRRRRHAACS